MTKHFVGVPVPEGAPSITCTDLLEQARSADNVGLCGTGIDRSPQQRTGAWLGSVVIPKRED